MSSSPTPFSPTGYWAIVVMDDQRYELLTQVTRQLAEEDGTPYQAPRRVAVLPVVKIGANDVAAILDADGYVVHVDAIPYAKCVTVTPEYPGR